MNGFNVNNVSFGGVCARTPIVEHFGTEGKQRARFVVRNGKDSDDPEDRTYIECVAYPPAADEVISYVQKGDDIVVEGRLAQEQWKDTKTGERRERIKIIVRKVYWNQARPL